MHNLNDTLQEETILQGVDVSGGKREYLLCHWQAVYTRQSWSAKHERGIRLLLLLVQWLVPNAKLVLLLLLLPQTKCLLSEREIWLRGPL